MHIACPECRSAFELPDAFFGGRGRKLKCARCRHAWAQGADGKQGGLDAAQKNAPPPNSTARSIRSAPTRDDTFKGGQ